MGAPPFPGAELLVFWGGVQFAFNGFKHKPVDYAKALACPALFMHGAEDPRAKAREARRVCEATKGPSTFELFASTAHEAGISNDPETWRIAVHRFLSEISEQQHR